MSDSMKIQPAATQGVHSVAPTDATDPRVHLIAAAPSAPAPCEERAPASEKAARFAELEIHTENQRDRLVTARKTQEFLHHDRESGISYHLIDGTLVQGSFRGGAPSKALGPAPVDEEDGAHRA